MSMKTWRVLTVLCKILTVHETILLLLSGGNLSDKLQWRQYIQKNLQIFVSNRQKLLQNVVLGTTGHRKIT